MRAQPESRKPDGYQLCAHSGHSIGDSGSTPPMILTKSFLTFNSGPGNPGDDPALSKNFAIVPAGVAFVGMQFGRALSGSATLLTGESSGCMAAVTLKCMLIDSKVPVIVIYLKCLYNTSKQKWWDNLIGRWGDFVRDPI